MRREAVIRKLLEAPRPEDRREAAMALSRFGPFGSRAATPEAMDALVRALLTDPDGWVRQMAAGALGDMGPQAATPDVLVALARAVQTDWAGPVRAWAADALGKLGDAAARPEVLQALVWALWSDESGSASPTWTPPTRLGSASSNTHPR